MRQNGRIYDPGIGRFLSPDPLIQNPYDLQSYNRYSYCLNNPLKYTDPTGYYSVFGLEFLDGGGLTGFARDSLKYVGAASRGAAEGLTDPVRLEGVAKMATGTLEMMASAPLLASGAGTAGGAVLAYQGGDLAGAGLMQALTGVSTETTIHQIGETTAKAAGASDAAANIVGTATEMAVGLGGAASVSRLSASAVRSAASSEVKPTVAATKGEAGSGAKNADKGLVNPFKGKNTQEIHDMFIKKGYQPRGPDPLKGKGGYVNPKNGRSYHIDEANSFGEPSHIDVNRPRGFDRLDKKKLPFGLEEGD